MGDELVRKIHIINMSKIDTKKELIHSFEDGLFKTLGLMGVGYIMGGNKPSLNPSFKNGAILTASIMTFDLAYDYAKAQGWLPFSKK